MGWPQTVHVPPVLHAVASCALLAQLVYIQNKWYISAGEAAWHQNEVADRKPAVNRLQLHLLEEQTVYFDSNKKDESIERIEKAAQTKLTSFFELNCQDKFARILLYWQIPEHYTWNTKQRK